jgi:16S rRNA (cytosine967-C5)-methyltransferase
VSLLSACADALHSPAAGLFDAVLVDAPCSALGILSRHPEIRWHRQESDIAALSRVQAALLQASAGSVRPGGRLIYATCTTEPEENEGVVEAFLAARSDFALERADAVLQIPGAANYLCIQPDEAGSDGAFAARLVRTR